MYIYTGFRPPAPWGGGSRGSSANLPSGKGRHVRIACAIGAGRIKEGTSIVWRESRHRWMDGESQVLAL